MLPFTKILNSTCSILKQNKHGICLTTDTSKLPTQARVVICGAGAIANSVAYHLIENGWTDVVLIDRGRICEGTSYFGSGMLGLFKPIAERNIILYSIKLYRQFQAKGFDIGLKQCGSLNLAQNSDRMIDLKRKISYNVPTGLHCEVLNNDDIKKFHPFLNTDDLNGAVWVPEDAVANSQTICKAFAQLSSQGGAQYVENCNVNNVITENGSVKGVDTSKGFISCEYFVNCAGMWARELGWLCTTKVRVPVYPVELFYVTTNAMPGVTADLPCVRDFDSSIYIRQYNDGYMVGGFKPVAKPTFTNYRLIPEDWKNTLSVDWDHFKPFWDKANNRIPSLKKAVYPVLINAPDAFTPDGQWIIGETPEVRNYFVAVGMNGNPIQGAGGIGRAVAEWIIAGEPTQDLSAFDVQRFLDLHNNRQYLEERTKEIVGRRYSIRYPVHNEYKTARNIRCSMLHSLLEKRGAVFESRMGFERPMYFKTKKLELEPLPSFYRPSCELLMTQEYKACTESIGIIDMSSLCKTRISGRGNAAMEWLQKLCSNDVNTPIGGIVHTGMQNERGGYENDCILVRESEHRYLMISPTGQQTKCFHWMQRFLPHDGSIDLKDVTSMYSVINVVGPKAKNLLSDLSQTNIDLHPFTSTEVDVGYASGVVLMSFTHTGEQGFSLYIPSEYTIHVYNSLLEMSRQQRYYIRDVGFLTQRSMRIARFIPFMGEDLFSDTTPFESGSGYKVKLDKEYFIGKLALQKQKDEGVTKRLVMFTVDHSEILKGVGIWGMEPIYRNNEFVGNVTSSVKLLAGYGYIFLGYVHQPSYYRQKYAPEKRGNLVVTNNFIMDPSAQYEVDVAGKRFVAEAHLSPPLPYEYPSFETPSKPATSVVRPLR